MLKMVLYGCEMERLSQEVLEQKEKVELLAENLNQKDNVINS